MPKSATAPIFLAPAATTNTQLEGSEWAHVTSILGIPHRELSPQTAVSVRQGRVSGKRTMS
jgi:hypothetical protein